MVASNYSVIGIRVIENRVNRGMTVSSWFFGLCILLKCTYIWGTRFLSRICRSSSRGYWGSCCCCCCCWSSSSSRHIWGCCCGCICSQFKYGYTIVLWSEYDIWLSGLLLGGNDSNYGGWLSVGCWERLPHIRNIFILKLSWSIVGWSLK